MSNDNSNRAGSRGDDASAVGGEAAGPAQGPEGGAQETGVSSDEMDAHSNGSSGNETAGHESRSGSSCHDKDSGLLETTESNKSSDSQSLSPPSSSIAYSLLSGSSEQDNPSTSGCSSDQSARVKTQKELMKALKELKLGVPSERPGKGKSSTLAALQYALSCVKQVRGNQQYFHQWAQYERQPCSLDLSAFTIEELENITSACSLKNTDTFSVVVSYLTGQVVYASHQASYVLRCKPEALQGARFSELLAPQDVSVFYSSTAPCRLPSWSACMGAAVAPLDCAQEKSMFCRISSGRERGGGVRYCPFRLAPYLLTLRDPETSEAQPCCLLLAEKIHSGYEAPRIPSDKRVFTTSHTPSCLFQDVDERAVPLLGYLPQDLVGTPVLPYLHPEDRPVMIAIHKKILKLAGQPFDHSPIRFCARNGEYLTIDTSWSSFVNPWTRKVAFIIGRHKVRTSPLNEDVFSLPRVVHFKSLEPEIHQLSGQIHRLLVQPVVSSGSQGYCSVESSGSPEQLLSIASSSDSNAAEEARLHKPVRPRILTSTDQYTEQHPTQYNTLQTSMYQHTEKHRNKLLSGVVVHSSFPPSPVVLTVGCLPLLSAVGSSETPRQPGETPKETVYVPRISALKEAVRKEPPSTYSYQQINCLDSIIRYLQSCNTPSTVKRKCGSTSGTTSSNSDDDKQNNRAGSRGQASPASAAAPPASGQGGGLGSSHPLVPLAPLALPSKAASVVSVTSQCSFSSTIVHVGDKKPPESDIVMMEDPATPSQAPPLATPSATPDPKDPYRRVGLTKEVLSVHTQNEEEVFLNRFKDLSELRVFDPAGQEQRGNTHGGGNRGAMRSSRNYPTGGSSSRRGKSKAKRLKHQQLSSPQGRAAGGGRGAAGLGVVGREAMGQAPAPLVAPVMAFVLPNYLFPQLGSPLPQPVYPNPSQMYPSAQAAAAPSPLGSRWGESMGGASPLSGTPKPLSRSSTPQSGSCAPHEREGARSPLFESQCSSPLQLNLLQLEDSTPNRQEVATQAAASIAAAAALAAREWAGPQARGGARKQAVAGSEVVREQNKHARSLSSPDQDAMSSSTDLLDLLLQEDSRSGSGSAASGSGSASRSSGSGSKGCSGSASGTRSSRSSHTSKYFGSIDSSENGLSGTQRDGSRSGAGSLAPESEQLLKCVLQDPLWLLMASADEKVMMTYQIPARDIQTVLREDRERLKAMQRQQPRFSEAQKRELSEVHPWIRSGRLPTSLRASACVGCGLANPVAVATPLDVEVHDMELSGMLDSREENDGKATVALETAMEEGGEEPATHGNDQEMPAEERETRKTENEDKRHGDARQ
ncbi:LOW QUALITY PROTEIN: period circadian protein homolog 1-like [Polyodon spathula]|uniref:LOW QUALITY PROTEIN: period circadian protein homolog 1-like n=1 Tax=Polyodon spathula TaxID=7913 RepID=UPI001B7F5B61|nr:LOW QUALITY PROTEIN: period circadian protein homolog 1-like [Polyodon spathula]